MTTNPGLSCSIWLNLFINRNGRKYVWPLETGDLAIDSWSRGDFCASRHNRACEFDLCMRCEKYLPSKPIIAYTPYFVLIACLKLQSWDSYHETPKFERERKKKTHFFLSLFCMRPTFFGWHRINIYFGCKFIDVHSRGLCECEWFLIVRQRPLHESQIIYTIYTRMHATQYQ